MADYTLIPSRFAAVTPSDTANLTRCIGLYCGGGGNVQVSGDDEVAAIFSVSAGQYLTGKFRKVWSTNTTATGLVALIAGD